MTGLRLLIAIAAAASALAAELPEGTLRAWHVYVQRTEARIDAELESADGFLVVDFLEPRARAECRESALAGKVCIQRRRTLTEESKDIEVPGGMIHHWYGAVFIPGATLDRVLSWVQSYDGRERFYPEVERSRLLENEGDRYLVFLRLKRKKTPLTVRYDTEHEVTYRRHGPLRASSRSLATRIRELEDAGGGRQVERPPGEDRGFLWRLHSYWRFEEGDSGTWVECESLSLSRSPPRAAEWLAREFIRSVPRESLESALLPLREHLKPIRSDRPQPKR